MIGATQKGVSDLTATRAGSILWQVDAQRDFMLPGGALYVPGAERLLPNIKKLVDLARKGGVFLISSACQHTPDDPEFKTFPPHCIRGTPGAQLVPEACAGKLLTVPSDRGFLLPQDLLDYQQVLLEKQVLDVFTNPHAAEIVEKVAPDTEFIVYGVVTEYCVRLAAKGLLERGRRVAVVADAIETLAKPAGQATISELVASGARLLSTEQVLAHLIPRQ